MKKLFFVFALLIASFCGCNEEAEAKIAVPRFNLVFDVSKEFDIGVFVVPGQLDSIPENQVAGQEQVTSHYALKITDPETKMVGEVRYTLYKDTVGGNPSKNEVLSDINQIIMIHMLNAFGTFVPSSNFMQLNDAMVKAKTKGDFGGRSFVNSNGGIPTEYGKGWNYAQVEYFYKAGQGLVIRTFLFNDKKFAGLNEDFSQASDYAQSPLSHVYWSFVFAE